MNMTCNGHLFFSLAWLARGYPRAAGMALRLIMWRGIWID